MASLRELIQPFLGQRRQGLRLIEEDMVPRTWNGHDLSPGDVGPHLLRALSREDCAFGAPYDERRTMDGREIRRWAAWDAEPARIKFEAESSTRLHSHRVRGDRVSQCLLAMIGAWYESKPLDGLLAAGVVPPECEGQTGHSARFFGGTSGGVDEE